MSIANQMDETLHVLDLGFPRFTELQLSIVLDNAFDLEILRSKALELVKSWPVLKSRLNLDRTQLLSSNSNVDGLWRAQYISHTLDDALPYMKVLPMPTIIDSTILNGIFDDKLSWKDRLWTRVLQIQAVSLLDACLISFKVQHPLCDAKGVVHIVQAYCKLLAGEPLEPLGPRLPLTLKNNSAESTLKYEEQSALRHREFFSTGWLSILRGAFRQKRKCWRRSRTEKAVFIPQIFVDNLWNQGQRADLRVTKHDILLAWIYHAIDVAEQPPVKRRHQHFQVAFVMNIAKMLKSDSDLSNPILIVPIKPVKPTSSSNVSIQFSVLDTAVHIRSAIEEARRPAPVQQMINQHKSIRRSPLVPTDWGTSHPSIIISSWANLPLFNLSFANTRGACKPVYVQRAVRLCPLLRSFGLSFDDGLLIWLAEDGYWIQGHLDDRTWSRLVDF